VVAIQVRHVQHAIERFDPDVLLTSTLALGPLIAGEIADLPVAVLGLATYLWPVAIPGGERRAADPQAEYRHREMTALYNAARGLFGLSPSPEKADRKSTRLNSSHGSISYAVFCLKKKNNNIVDNEKRKRQKFHEK